MEPLVLFESNHQLYDRYTGALCHGKYDKGIAVDSERKLTIKYFASPADSNNPAMVLWQLYYVYEPGAVTQLVDIRFYGDRDVSILMVQLPSRIAKTLAYIDKYIEVVNNLVLTPLMPNIMIYRRETYGYNIIYANIGSVTRRLRINDVNHHPPEMFMSTNIYEKYGHEYSAIRKTASSIIPRQQRVRPIVTTVPVRSEQQLSMLHATSPSTFESSVAGTFTPDDCITQEDIEYVYNSTVGRQ